MRFYYTLIALLILLLIGSGAYYTYLKNMEANLPPSPLFPFSGDNISKISKVIIWGRQDQAVCEKQGKLGWWYFTNSKMGKVDNRKINSILYEMANMIETDPVVKEAKDLAEFGLDKEDVAVEVYFLEKLYKIILGKANIDQNYYYGRRENSRDIILFPANFYKLVNKSSIELADMRVLGEDVSQIEEVGFRKNAQEYQLIKTATQFKLTKPQEKLIDTAKAFNIFRYFADLQIPKMGAEPVKIEAANINKPDLILTVTIRGEPIEISLVRENEKTYYAKRSGDEQVMEIRKSVIENLITSVENLLLEEKSTSLNEVKEKN